jgi:hypothetical protein
MQNYVPEEKHTNTTTHRYGVDSNWYAETGTTDHITRELDKLVIYDKYNVTDQIRTASGAGMNINCIGKAIVSTLNRNLHLNNVLYVPNAQKNLVSVHRLAADNNAFLEFHPNFFFISRASMGSARCASRRGTTLPHAGITSMQITYLKRSMPTLPLIATALIATGT